MNLNIIKYAPLIEKVRTSFWFIPSFMVSVATGLAALTVYLDASYVEALQPIIPMLYGTDITAIRSLLGTIAGSMITVTSIAFSITIVALTLASSQFGSRLVRNFMMDKGTQVVLGSFIANFLFCILIFCAISFQQPYAFQPGITLIVAVTMTFISVGVLIYFIHHVAKSIQADVVIDDVYQELQSNINNLFPAKDEKKTKPLAGNSATNFNQTNSLNVLVTCSGYIKTIDQNALLLLAAKYNCVLDFKVYPGDFVVQNAIIATVYCAHDIDNRIADKTLKHITFGAYRTPIQDPEFALHQLVEIALRALSPGINDPYTAITCIDKLNSVLCGLTNRNFPAKYHYGPENKLRLVCKTLEFDDVGNAAFNQIRQQASKNIAVTIRLLESMAELMRFVKNAGQKQFVLSQTKMIAEQQSQRSIAKQDLAVINNLVDTILAK